ncbi:hypothetical protein CHS0354_001009 [Potamilus streckersoni]|uniref:Uncharacterized protein n=1 Tax=Potamilus streckersoni TaxID=2493646 RepID=A0AAE0RUX0_9BIVA|nr:hypothetical protein CHS0354_001009 [Potamilus streckersoni]
MGSTLHRYLGNLAYVVVLLEGIWGYQMFQEIIPNGEIVPHPCKANIWRGVGHKMVLGGGERNQFGLDFSTAGKQWTKALCQLDSDGDGKTNGEELGDPHCLWTKGQSPSRSSGLSHPGVCEPVNSTLCEVKNFWVSCQKEEFKCDAINQNETKNVTVRFPVTEIPPKETTYKCMIFDLPQDGDYHLVATEAIIDNVNAMHHIIVYGCKNVENSTIPLNEPYDCDMLPGGGCSDIIGLWQVGVTGECHHEISGFRIGVNGYKRAAFEVHWNNPALLNGTTDSSGLTFYYTSKHRQYDAGALLFGQVYLYIPPNEKAVTALAACPGDCTRKVMKDNIYITFAFNHMHYLGIHQRIEVWRNGSKVQNVTFDEKYMYDNPVIYRFDNPIEVRPGDELRTTCIFKSTSRYKTTTYGMDTSKEMCLAIIAYYPKDNFALATCHQWNSISTCDWEKDVIQGCRHKDILNITIPESAAIYRSVTENCAPLGKCQKECVGIVKETKQHPCFQGDMDKLQRMKAVTTQDPALKNKLMDFFAALDSCNFELALEAKGLDDLNTSCTTSSDGIKVCSRAGPVFTIQPLLLFSSFAFLKFL